MPALAETVPVTTVEELMSAFDIPKLDHHVEQVCETACWFPRTFYLFMQRYTHFNGYAGSLVARLASSVGLSRELFKVDCEIRDEADRGMSIAQAIFAATVDEHADISQKVPHRTLAQATLHAVGDYAGLSVSERNAFAVLPNWMHDLMADTINGYQGLPGNVEALIRAIGFHAGSEFLADREYSIIDKVVRHNHPYEGFDAYIRRNRTVLFDNQRIGIWYWIAVHGRYEEAGVEAEHFNAALTTINLVAQFRPEPVEQIREWVLEGFGAFVEVQQKLFSQIGTECETLIRH